MLMLKISFLFCIILFAASEQINGVDSVTTFALPEPNTEFVNKPNSLLAVAMLESQKRSNLVADKFEATLSEVLPLIKKLVDRACQNIAVQECWRNEAETNSEFYNKRFRIHYTLTFRC